jgi:ribosome biogenesis GTPase
MEESELKLDTLGWNSFFAGNFHIYQSQGCVPARVSLEHKNSYVVWCELGETPGALSGRMYYDAYGRGDLPAVGDWVAAQVLDERDPHAVIHAVLPRKSKVSRKQAGKSTNEQVLAANIDTLFVVVGLDDNFSLRRIERYVTLAWDTGARPVVVLSKADVCADAETRVREAEGSVPGVRVHAVSSVTGLGLDALGDYLLPGETAALVGSSGVGKSTIINYLLGNEVQRTQEVRLDDSKGRHTTTRRQMFALSSGALVIDTPGMRELGLWGVDEGLSGAFADIAELGLLCRFADCTHRDEPGCIVRQAVHDGDLDSARFENYQKMQKELEYLVRKQDKGSEAAERAKWKTIHKQARKIKKDRYG